ncbi:hydrolase [Acidovorax carolinensis]|uniref:Hydrolase n=1 Tax=Acidovorax carolinensis TaxID=553814 RepID=A0A240U989_9BURK|nr:hydrolase [Acidovorax carolinensis]ART56418.1 hydrolase [Acidovorax carolinensis]ART57625.1 hydrolase [Acidovorax carolinensis]
MHAATEQLVRIPVDSGHIEGALECPAGSQGLVLFAHGSGSSRHSPRNNFVARVLRERGLATLLVDLLTPEEDRAYATRFDIPLLTQRLLDVTDWARRQPATALLPVGYFGASTGAAAALSAAAALGDGIGAVVSRGGRPDLAPARDLARVQCPTLLLVGACDEEVLALNRRAAAHMPGPTTLTIVPHATHLFEEPGTLEAVARLAADWFAQHLRTRAAPASSGE